MNGQDNETEKLISIIETEFPEIPLESYEILESGWDNHLVIANGEWAFKIPRRPELTESLRKEVLLTRCISDSPVNVPDFTLVADTQAPYVAGYRYIEGRALNTIDTLPVSIRDQLVGFLNYLHKKSEDRCITEILGAPSEEKWTEIYNQYRETVFSNLFDVLDDQDLSILAVKFQEFQSNLSTLSVSLVHGDLYRGNVIIDKTGSLLNGIIDWGTACLGDPAIDFAALAVDFGISEIEDMLSRYKGRIDSNFRQRMEFYWQLEPTYGIIYFRDRDQDAYEMLVKELTNRLRNGLY